MVHLHLKKSEAPSSSSSSTKKNKKDYPATPELYQLYEEIGQGASASVYRALCIPLNEIVAIKILDFENGNMESIAREAQTMGLVDHPSVVNGYCSFAFDRTMWAVMEYMNGGSCHHILKAAYPEGFPEVVIATILREALKGLDYLHHNGHIHRDVKAGNILVDSQGTVKLGDFGVSASLFDCGDRLHRRHTFVGTPCWMAPEVMSQSAYDVKADIWSFGITALELAHGHAPFSRHPPYKVLLMTLQNAPPGLDYERDKKFSKSFRQMIAMCLVKEPSKRPSAQKLLKHHFFKHGKPSEPIVRTLLEGLPTLGKRMEFLKIKEANMLAEEKISDVKKEEMSQNEYKRGLSEWNFDIDILKAEAALNHDDEDSSPEKDDISSSPETEECSHCSKDDANKENKNNACNVKPGNSELDIPLAKLNFSEDSPHVEESRQNHGKTDAGDHKVERKGRFTVTDGDVDIEEEKAHSSSKPLPRSESEEEFGPGIALGSKGRFTVTNGDVDIQQQATNF